MASRQSRAGQLIQPADPWICWWFLIVLAADEMSFGSLIQSQATVLRCGIVLQDAAPEVCALWFVKVLHIRVAEKRGGI